MKKHAKKEKKEMKKEILYWLVGILVFSVIFLGIIQFTSAETLTSNIGTMKQNTCFDLYQICDDCSYVNLTSIKYPNGIVENFNLYMTKSGQNFNYTFCNSSLAGGYTYTVAGNKGGSYSVEIISFSVSPSGTILSSAQSSTYILIFVISLLIFAGLMIIGLYLPISNDKDEMTGYILAVNNLKYLKLVCLGLAYLVAMVLAYLAWMLCYSFLPEMEFLATLFKFLFYGTAIATLPLFMLFVYLIIANINRDGQISDLLSRGLTTRGGD